MSRLRSEYEAHQSIVAQLDARRRIDRNRNPRPQAAARLFLQGAATGAILAAVWIGAYLWRVA